MPERICVTVRPKKARGLSNYDKESNEYKKKRLRNNIAVRKSRDKGTGFLNSKHFPSQNAIDWKTRNF